MTWKDVARDVILMFVGFGVASYSYQIKPDLPLVSGVLFLIGMGLMMIVFVSNIARMYK